LLQSKRGYKPPFPFQKCSQLFIRAHDEASTVVAVCVHNPDRSVSSPGG
jgi:hypothetical protein